METTIAVFAACCLIACVLVLAWVICAIFEILALGVACYEFFSDNGLKLTLKILVLAFIPWVIFAAIIAGLIYFLPWQVWVAICFFLLVPLAAAGAASHKTPRHLRPGFYAKVFEKPWD